MKNQANKARWATNLPNKEIAKRIENTTVPVKVGDKVLVTRADGSQYLAEVIEFSSDIRGWITKVKKVNADGSTSIEEVAELTVEAVMILQDIVLSDIFKTVMQWLRNVFRKKPKTDVQKA